MKTENLTEENSRGNKVLGYIGLAVGAIAVGIFGYHVYKKAKTMKTQKKQAKQEIEELGVSPVKLNQEVKYHEKSNFVKTLFTSVTFKADAVIDNDVLDTDEAFDSTNTVHVFQKRRNEVWTGGNFKNFYNQNFLEFLVEIPDYINDNSGLTIRDYVKCIKDAARHMSEEYCKFSPEPEKELIGFLEIEYSNPRYDPEDEYSYKMLNGFVELPRRIYKDFEDGKGHGVSRLYALVAGKDTFGEAEESVGEYLNHLYPGLKVKPRNMGLAYRIVFPIRDEANWAGLTLKNAIDCIGYLCNEFRVTKHPDTGAETDYSHIIFHAPNSRGKWSWRRFYDVENNHVIVKDYNDR